MDEVTDWLTPHNHRRLHSTLGYLSPMKFEETRHAGQSEKAA
jgi:transposase InsO family protein